MLEKVEKHQKAFQRLDEEDPNYLRTIREEEKEEGNDRHEVAWGLDDVDWEKIMIFSKFLKFSMMQPCGFQVLIMSPAILFFFFFWDLMSIHDTIDQEYKKDGYLLRKMAEYKKNKFERYWGNFDNMNNLLYVMLVLDP